MSNASKPVLIGILFIYISLVTVLASLLGLSDTVATLPSLEGYSALAPSAIIDTFWSLLTFSVSLPLILTIIFVHAPLLILVTIILEYLIELIPF